MTSLPHSGLRSFGLTLLIGGLLAGSLSGCAARRRLQASETATAASPASSASPASPPTAAGSGSAAATSATSPAEALDAQLQQMDSELNSVDTLNDFTTVLPPDAATSTPAPAAGPTETAGPNQPTRAPQSTAVSSGADQGAQLDQLLGAMQDQLNKTDTVPEAANP